MNVAPHIAERIARAQDMLGRLGQRDAYEPNYTGEKLADAARSCIEALALLGESRDDLETMAERAWESGRTQAEALNRNAQRRLEMADGLACVRCGERDGAMEVAGTLAGSPRRVFEHAECRQDGLAAQIEVDPS